MVLLLLTFCLLLLLLWESVIVLCFVTLHLDGEERAGCFDLFVFLMFRDGSVALPFDVMGPVCLRFAIVVFPDHTQLLIRLCKCLTFITHYHM